MPMSNKAQGLVSPRRASPEGELGRPYPSNWYALGLHWQTPRAADRKVRVCRASKVNKRWCYDSLALSLSSRVCLAFFVVVALSYYAETRLVVISFRPIRDGVKDKDFAFSSTSFVKHISAHSLSWIGSILQFSNNPLHLHLHCF
jgi:hypothetical protein